MPSTDVENPTKIDPLNAVVEQWELELLLEHSVPCDFPDHGKYAGKVPPCSGPAVAFARLHNHRGTWCQAAVTFITGIDPVLYNINCSTCHEPFNLANQHPSVSSI
jgi:hypothetical protein